MRCLVMAERGRGLVPEHRPRVFPTRDTSSRASCGEREEGITAHKPAGLIVSQQLQLQVQTEVASVAGRWITHRVTGRDIFLQ